MDANLAPEHSLGPISYGSFSRSGIIPLQLTVLPALFYNGQNRVAQKSPIIVGEPSVRTSENTIWALSRAEQHRPVGSPTPHIHSVSLPSPLNTMWEQMGAAMERSAQEMARYPAVYSPSEIVFQDAIGDTVTEFIGPRAIANLTARSTGARPYNRTKSLVLGTAHPRSKISGFSGNA
jgi:hypothetical protein